MRGCAHAVLVRAGRLSQTAEQKKIAIDRCVTTSRCTVAQCEALLFSSPSATTTSSSSSSSSSTTLLASLSLLAAAVAAHLK